MSPADGEPDAYQRGQAAGKIDSRLEGHDKHFAAINGSLERISKELTALHQALTRLEEGQKTRDALVVTTAAALKAAEEERRDRREQVWIPVAKTFAVISAFATVLGIAIALGIWTKASSVAPAVIVVATPTPEEAPRRPSPAPYPTFTPK